MDELLWILIAFAAVMIGAGFVQSCLGFGYAVVALAILPYFMDIRVANLALSLSIIVPTIVGAWAYREHAEWRTISWSIAGAALALPLGLLTFAYLPVDVLARVTGTIILLIVLLELKPRCAPRSETSSHWASASMGAVSGFLTGAIGIGGPPIAVYAVRQAWSHTRLKAFLLNFLLVLSVMKAIGVMAVGWVDQTVALYTLIAIPFATTGTHLGIAASRRIDARHFRRAVLVILIIASAGMTFRGGGSKSNNPEPAQSVTSILDSIAVLFHGTI